MPSTRFMRTSITTTSGSVSASAARPRRRRRTPPRLEPVVGRGSARALTHELLVVDQHHADHVVRIRASTTHAGPARPAEAASDSSTRCACPADPAPILAGSVARTRCAPELHGLGVDVEAHLCRPRRAVAGDVGERLLRDAIETEPRPPVRSRSRSTL